MRAVIDRFGRARRPREQRRPDAGRRVPRARAGRVGRGHRDRPQRGLPDVPGRDPGHGRARLGVDRQRRLAARPGGRRPDGRLQRREGRAHRAHPVAGDGVRARGRPGQRGRPRIHADRDDRRHRGHGRRPAAARGDAHRAVRAGGRGRRRGPVPALRRVGACSPARRSTRTAGGTCHEGRRQRPRRDRARPRRRDGRRRRVGGRARRPAAVHRRARRGVRGGGPPAGPHDRAHRRHRRLRGPRVLAARAARAHAPDHRLQHRQRAAAGGARRGGRARVVLVPPGRALPAHARDRGRPARARDAGRASGRTWTRARPAASRTPARPRTSWRS